MSKRMELVAWIGGRIGKPPGWERIVRAMASPKSCRKLPDMLVVRDGMSFLAQPSVPLGWYVVFFGSYEPEIRDIFRSVLGPDGVAIDVGANVGWHSLLMGRLAGQRGRVLAIEPNPAIVPRLKANIMRNRLENIEVLPVAIGAREGSADFLSPPGNHTDSGNGHIVEADAKDGATIRVRLRCLDDIARDHEFTRTDLIKIDVEGYEWPVLSGGRAVISKYRPHVIFEYNAEYTARGGGTPELLRNFFREQGYRLFAIDRLGAVAIDNGRWPDCADIWAVPEGT